MMKPSEYLLVRAQAVLEGLPIPRPLGRDWLEYIDLTRPWGLEEWGEALGSSRYEAECCLRLCLAAAIAKSEGQ